MSWLAPTGLRLAWLAALCAGCGAGSAPPASVAVEDYIDASDRNDARAAYLRLDRKARAALPWDDFLRLWESRDRERKQQLEELKGELARAPELGERALLRYGQGRTMTLVRDPAGWRLDHLPVAVATARPRDVARELRSALRDRSYPQLVGLLSERRRLSIATALGQLEESLSEPPLLEQLDPNRAVLRWDHQGIRYQLKLVRESGMWRIDEFIARPRPTVSDDSVEDGIE